MITSLARFRALGAGRSIRSDPRRPQSSSSSLEASVDNAGWSSQHAARWWSPAWPALATGLGAAATLTTGCIATRWQAGADSEEEEREIELLWVTELADRPGMRQAVWPCQMLANSPLRQLGLEEEEGLFPAMMRMKMLEGLQCYFNKDKKEFHAVVQLGKEVCSYPSTVHGGLTAAIIDETLGGLMAYMWRSGRMGLTLPGVTARLEVDYCEKVPQNALILCTAEVESVEGRKLWLKASVTDGNPNGCTYATARALFVTPNVRRTIGNWMLGFLPFAK